MRKQPIVLGKINLQVSSIENLFKGDNFQLDENMNYEFILECAELFTIRLYGNSLHSMFEFFQQKQQDHVNLIDNGPKDAANQQKQQPTLDFNSFMTEDDPSLIKETPQKVYTNRHTLESTSGTTFVSVRGLPASITSASGGYF